MKSPSVPPLQIALCWDVDRFFRRVVEEVRSRRRLETTEAATSYIVSLLVERIHSCRGRIHREGCLKSDGGYVILSKRKGGAASIKHYALNGKV